MTTPWTFGEAGITRPGAWERRRQGMFPLGLDGAPTEVFALGPAARGAARTAAGILASGPDLGRREGFGFTQLDPNARPALWEVRAAEKLVEILGHDAPGLCAALANAGEVLRIRGLASEASSPRTPYGGVSKAADIPMTLVNVFGVIGLMGARAFGYADENDARIVRDVVARADAGDEQSSQGWRAELPWHMDGAFRPLGEEGLAARTGLSPAPRWLVFGVIHPSADIPLTYAPIAGAAARLRPHILDALTRPQFTVSSPDSCIPGCVTRDVAMLLPDGQGGWFSRYNQGKCRASTDDGALALEALAAALADPDLPRRLEIEAGDVVVLDNWRALHMRSAYGPRWDGTDRWLVRIYATADIGAGLRRSGGAARIWL